MMNTDNQDFLKDPSTGALINKNKGALDEYRKKKAHVNRIENLEYEIRDIKNDLKNIRDLLIQIADR